MSSGLPRYLKLPWTQANYVACSIKLCQLVFSGLHVAVSYQQYISLNLSATKKQN